MFVRTKISLDLEKSGGHTFSSIGGRLILVVRQADDILVV